MLKMNGVGRFRKDRKGSLHLVSKCRYLGKYERYYITIEGKLLTLKYYNLGFLFSRITKEGKTINRYRVVGIGYDNQAKFAEFNKIYFSLTGKTFKKPSDGNFINFEELGHKLEQGIAENQFQVYVLWKDMGAYSSVEEISLFTGEQKITRTGEMDFPEDFYRKYVTERSNTLSLSE